MRSVKRNANDQNMNYGATADSKPKRESNGASETESPVPKKVKLTDYFQKCSKPVLNEKIKDDVGKEETKEVGLVTPLTLTPEESNMISEKALLAKLTKAAKTFRILDPNMGKTWFAALESEFRKDYFSKLDQFITQERTRTKIFPQPNHVWEWTKHCKIQDVKIVIIGQDPYHGFGQAHGLCFSVQKGVPIPPSLVNIYKELTNDFTGFIAPSHGHLKSWADEGVLLLNSCLTVEAGKANSHKEKGWEKITTAVISFISKELNNVVFLLWGSHAQKIAMGAVDKRKHHLLTAVHPSPLSAHRGFFGCKHFSKANELLLKSGRTPVNWNNLNLT